MKLCIHTYTYTCIFTYMSTCIYTHIHVHTYIHTMLAIIAYALAGDHMGQVHSHLGQADPAPGRTRLNAPCKSGEERISTRAPLSPRGFSPIVMSKPTSRWTTSPAPSCSGEATGCSSGFPCATELLDIFDLLFLMGIVSAARVFAALIGHTQSGRLYPSSRRSAMRHTLATTSRGSVRRMAYTTAGVRWRRISRIPSAAWWAMGSLPGRHGTPR